MPEDLLISINLISDLANDTLLKSLIVPKTDPVTDTKSISTMAIKIIDGLEERYQKTTKALPSYARWIFFLASGILILGLGLQTITNNLSNDQLVLIQSLKTHTIGSIVAFFYGCGISYVYNICIMGYQFYPIFCNQSI